MWQYGILFLLASSPMLVMLESQKMIAITCRTLSTISFSSHLFLFPYLIVVCIQVVHSYPLFLFPAIFASGFSLVLFLYFFLLTFRCTQKESWFHSVSFSSNLPLILSSLSLTILNLSTAFWLFLIFLNYVWTLMQTQFLIMSVKKLADIKDYCWLFQTTLSSRLPDIIILIS